MFDNFVDLPWRGCLLGVLRSKKDLSVKDPKWLKQNILPCPIS